MTTYRQPRGATFRYDFWYKPPGARESTRHVGPTGQVTKADADLVEAKIKLELRQRAGGIAPTNRMATPSFAAWADLHFGYVKKRGRVTRVDHVLRNLATLLLFFGKRPGRPRPIAELPKRWRDQVARRRAAAPYHDLRLADPIMDPEWVERFEDWMSAERLSGAMKNQLRSAASGLYRTALLPGYRKRSNVQSNPFLNLERDDVLSRERTLTQAQLWAWVSSAALHARIAMAIAAYAPKLRAGVILQLQWAEHFDPDLQRLVVQRHKARRSKRRPQVVLLPAALRDLLLWLREVRPGDKYVVAFRGEPVASLKTGLRAAVARANKLLPAGEQMTYGANGGVTFHTIRHTMATMLAELGISERLREAVMDQTADTIRGYTHLMPRHEQQPMARLAKKLQLVEAVQGKVVGPAARKDRKPQRKTPAAATAARRAKRA